MNDCVSPSEKGLDQWLAKQRHALIHDLATTLDLEAGLREAMIPARHADLVAGLRDVLDVEAGLSAIVSAATDDSFETNPESWRVGESPSSPGSVAVAVRKGASARVFLSHAKEDRALAGELERQLVADGHEVFLNQHVHADIAVGEEWQQRLHRRLQWADAMVCVVTSAYLASRQCTTEVAFAQSRGDVLLPVHAEPGVDDPLLDSVPEVSPARDSAVAALVKTLRRVDDAGILGWPKGRSPFPGLRPFDTDQHRVFFGRADEIKQLATLVQSCAAGAALVVGPSGCGKSSLVRAGLVPLLAYEPDWLALSPIVPGADPVAALAGELATEAQRVGLDWMAEHVRHRLDERGLEELADELLLAAPGGPLRHLLVVVDQFEELLTQTGPLHRARFAELLSSALTGPVRMVGTLRPEFLAQLLADPELARLSMEIYPLRPLRGEALRSIIEEPARLAGISVDEQLVTRLIDDAGSADALPLLAFTLAQLAEGVSRGGQLSPARYDRLGGMQGALTQHADTALADAVRASGLTEPEVLTGLTRLATVDETGRRTRQRIKLTSLTEPLRVALHVFVDRHLLISDVDDAGQVWLTVTHEALLTRWRPLDTATAAIIDVLRVARTVEHAAAEWDSSDRSEHYLWDDKRLTDTLNTLGMADSGDSHGAATSAPVELDTEARAFLDATAHRAHAFKQRERRRRTRTISAIVGLLVLALISASVTVWLQHNASNAQRIAIARQLVAQAGVARDTDPRTALQLGLAAQRIHPGQETESSLINLLTHTRYSGTLAGHSGPVLGVAFSPDRRTLATASRDGTTRLWDVNTRQQIVTLTVHTNAATAVAFSPDGRTLATGGGDGTVQLWDVATHRLLTTLTNTSAVDSVAFSPDGRTLATASSSDQIVRLWDVATHQTISTLTVPTNAVTTVAFSPDGRTLAIGNFDRTVQLWDLTRPQQPHRLSTLTGHIDAVTTVAFSPNGRTLATASSDQSVRLWDVSDPAHPTSLSATKAEEDAAKRHAEAERNQAAKARQQAEEAKRRAEEATVQLEYEAILEALADQARSERAEEQAQLRMNGFVRIIDLNPPLGGHTSTVNSVEFSPDGQTLATAGSDQSVRLWNVSDPAHPSLKTTLTGQSGVVRSVGFAPDGTTLATASDNGTTILWDLGNINSRRADPTARACFIAGGGLNPIQWARYIPELPYEQTCESR